MKHLQIEVLYSLEDVPLLSKKEEQDQLPDLTEEDIYILVEKKITDPYIINFSKAMV